MSSVLELALEFIEMPKKKKRNNLYKIVYTKFERFMAVFMYDCCDKHRWHYGASVTPSKTQQNCVVCSVRISVHCFICIV